MSRWTGSWAALIGIALSSGVALRAADTQRLEVEEQERSEDRVVLQASGELRPGGRGLARAEVLLDPALSEAGLRFTRREVVDQGEALVVWEDLEAERYQVTAFVGPEGSPLTVRLVASSEDDPAPIPPAVTMEPSDPAGDSLSAEDLIPFRWAGDGECFRVEVVSKESGLIVHQQQVVEHGIALPAKLFLGSGDCELSVSQADGTLRFGPAVTWSVALSRVGATEPCTECNGTGYRTTKRRCPVCGGRGEIVTGTQSRTVCGACQGTGERTEQHTCLACNGKGAKSTGKDEQFTLAVARITEDPPDAE